jgi:hypothetical protein
MRSAGILVMPSGFHPDAKAMEFDSPSTLILRPCSSVWPERLICNEEVRDSNSRGGTNSFYGRYSVLAARLTHGVDWFEPLRSPTLIISAYRVLLFIDFFRLIGVSLFLDTRKHLL